MKNCKGCFLLLSYSRAAFCCLHYMPELKHVTYANILCEVTSTVSASVCPVCLSVCLSVFGMVPAASWSSLSMRNLETSAAIFAWKFAKFVISLYSCLIHIVFIAHIQCWHCVLCAHRLFTALIQCMWNDLVLKMLYERILFALALHLLIHQQLFHVLKFLLSRLGLPEWERGERTRRREEMNARVR